MTISSTTRKAGPFVGNGVTTEFPFDFKLFSTSDLRVVRADALGVETDLVHVTDCTVTLNADQDENPGGSVVLNAPLADGFRLVLLSAVPELQPVDLTNQGGFYPELVNGGLDRATVQVQQLREQMSRSVTVPVTSEQFDLALPNPSPGQLIGWTGVGLTNFDPSELVSVVAYGEAKLDVFSGDGATTSFALSASPGSQNNLRIAIAGVVQTPGEDFTWAGGTALTFTSAPPAGTDVVVQYQEALQDIGGATEAGKAAAEAVLSAKVEKAGSLDALAAVPPSEGIVITPAGEFSWVGDNQAANILADPQRGVWVSITSDPMGLTGAWRRVFDGVLDAEWFGGRTSAALNAALAFAKASPYKSITATGRYVLTETVEYEGGTDDGVRLDCPNSTWARTGDYGPTFYAHGIPESAGVVAEALQRCRFNIGTPIDEDRSMTVANSRCHMLLDSVYFLEYGMGRARGGCGGVELLGCSQVTNVTDITARFDGGFKPGSVGWHAGASELPGFEGVHGGDIQINGAIDIYGGTMVAGVAGSTSGSSATITVSSSAGIAVGDWVEGIGLSGNDPHGLIPPGVTVTNIDGNTVTISAAVTLPADYSLVFFRPSIDVGFKVTAVDGLWGSDFIHSIFCGGASVAILPTAGTPIDNIILDVMPDFSPGKGLSIEGSGIVRHGRINVHNLYANSITATANRQEFSVFSDDQRWSLDGYRYGGPVQAPDFVVDGLGSFGFRRWAQSGVVRMTEFMDPGGDVGLNSHDDAGAYADNAHTWLRNARIWSLKWGVRREGYSLAQLNARPSIAPTDEYYCSDARALAAGGNIEASPGGGAMVMRNAANTKWVLIGTNIEAQT